MTTPHSADAPAAPPRMVVCAANKYGPYLFVGVRHFCPIMLSNMDGCEVSVPTLRKMYGEQQGFIDQHGEFLTREEAWNVAEAAGQIRRRVGGNGEKLFSENLY